MPTQVEKDASDNSSDRVSGLLRLNDEALSSGAFVCLCTHKNVVRVMCL